MARVVACVALCGSICATAAPSVLPFEDKFEDAEKELQTEDRVAGIGTNKEATREEREPLHDGKPTEHTMWLFWRAPANGIATVSTFDSDFDTVIAVYTGDAVDKLAPVASDDDSGKDHTSLLAFNAVAGTIYRIAVAGYFFAEGRITFELELNRTADRLPEFQAQPRHTSVAPGEDVNLFFELKSQEPVEIQWLFRGEPIPNESESSLLIRKVDENSVGSYRARLTTSKHTIFSRSAEVQINSRGLPNVLAQDKLGDAIDFGLYPPDKAKTVAQPKSAKAGGSGSHGYTVTQIFSTVGTSADPGEPVHCGIGGGHSQWFVYQAEADGTLRIDTEGSSFDTVLAVYVGPGTSYATLTNVACDNNSGANGLASKVIFDTKQGMKYWIAVDGVGNSAGVVHLHMVLGEPLSISSQPQSLIVPSGSNPSFTVVADGMTNYTYQWRFGGTNIAGATSSTFTRTGVPASLAGNYDVVVRNPINSLTSSVATLTVYSSTLSITNQPQSGTVIAGTNISLVVGASGAGLIGCQWRLNGTNLVGATNSSIPLLNVQTTDAGVYSVNVTDANGSLLSSDATLTVLAPPVITLHPSSSTLALGAATTLSGAASGTPAPAYQWFFNGTLINGATLSTFPVSDFQSTNQGIYLLRASNSIGIATSAGAELLLNAPLRFTNCLWSNGVFTARLIGMATTNYVVQISSNATSWIDISTNSSASGICSFITPNTNSGCWLFRAIVP